MNSQIKYEYAKQHWELRDGIVYSKLTGNPVSFACKNKEGHRFVVVKVNNKMHAILIHEAVFALFHNRPIAEWKEIHHKDGDPENNAVSNLVELTKTQHGRIHKYQANDPMRGICLHNGAWQFIWQDDNGHQRSRRFHGINEAMAFRDEIEEPRRQQNNRLFRTHI